MNCSAPIVINFSGLSLPVKSLTLAELKAAEKIDFEHLPKWVSSMIFGKIGAFFHAKTFKNLPLRMICQLYDSIIRAQYGALLDCPAGWREQLTLGRDNRTPFVRLCDKEARRRLSENGRSRLEYSIAQLSAIVCSAFGGKVKINDLLLPEGTFGKAKPKPKPAKDQILELANAIGATIVDLRQKDK